MPIHDWTRVDAGIFHHFHQRWVGEIAGILNAGLLPDGYYALAEQVATGYGPDVLTLRAPGGLAPSQPRGGVALADAPPRVKYHAKADEDVYADKADLVAIRHRSRHQTIALVEVVSPGNRSSTARLDAFVRKAEAALRAGIHLLVVGLFPPTTRDPQGIHRAIWQARHDEFVRAAEAPLTCAAYVGGDLPEAHIQPVRAGDALPDMPLFLRPDVYVPVPLDETYITAWRHVPGLWRDVLTAPA